MLKNKKILLGITGGIAAYKSVELARQLIKSGAIVKTIMTKSAMEFISPLTFRTITQETVSFKLFDNEAPIEHISLADWADILVIAPATANIIGKIANGIADDLLSTTIMATTCPKLLIPAMNVNMYENLIVQENIKKLKEYEYHILEPDNGDLACGYKGKGRMPDINEILYAIKTAIFYKQDLSNKKILISAGASIEKIDPMRYITNVSSGKMGLSIARAAFLRGANVTIIHSSLKDTLPFYTNNIEVLSAGSMYKEMINHYKKYDIIIMCAAVADYTPSNPSDKKIKKKDDMTLELKRTKDILAELGKLKKPKQILVGFAAESEDIVENAKKKLNEKNLDMIVANHLDTAGRDEAELYIITKEKTIYNKGDKFAISHGILNSIINKE